jgi:hypothetical protein
LGLPLVAGTLKDVSPRQPQFPITLPAGDDHPRIDHNSTAEDLEALVEHPDPWVRAAAACNFATTAEQRRRFATDRDVRVRFALASTSRSSADVDELCGDDPDPWVRARAVTYCVHRDDQLSFGATQAHERLAARNHRTAASLCDALFADQPCGAPPARHQMHELFCVGRAGIALLLRDDCDDTLADTAIVRLAQAFDASDMIRGTGAGKWTSTGRDRCELLTPLRERQEQPWRHHAKVAELLEQYDRVYL